MPGTRSSRTENQEPGTENHVHPGCAGVLARMRRLRAEALAEHVEAPAGLRRRASLGARASRTENQEPGTENHVPPGSADVPNREPRTENREPRAPWERGRPEPRTRNQEPRTTCILGARASRTENQEPGTENHMHPGCAGVPARMCATPARARSAGVPPACARPRRVPGVRASRPHVRDPGAYQECGHPEPRTRNQEPRTTCLLGARAVPPACGDCGLMEIEHSIRYALLLWG